MNHVSTQSANPGFELVNAAGAARTVLTCDHAGNFIPPAYDGLGLPAERLREHIAWDIGAAAVTRGLAARLDAPAVLATHSRLFIDPNRKLGSAESILRVSDGVEVPGNANVSPEDATLRAELAFWPYHHAIEREVVLGEHHKGVLSLLSIHSFTPVMAGYERPWHVGILYDRDDRLARPVLDHLEAQGDITVGDNQPYSATHPPGYGFEAYGTSAGRPHVMIEIRQDLIETDDGAEEWADRLAAALAGVLSDASLFEQRFYR